MPFVHDERWIVRQPCLACHDEGFQSNLSTQPKLSRDSQEELVMMAKSLT